MSDKSEAWNRAYINSRRHPRTMSEAFGPYTSNDLQPMREERNYSAAWWWAMWVIAVITLILIFNP